MASAARRLVLQPPRTSPVRTARQKPLTIGQIARDLNDLIEMGFVERFTDEHNVTRYRPRLVAAKRSLAC